MFELNRRPKVAYWKDRLVTWARLYFRQVSGYLGQRAEIKPLSERQQETLLAIAHHMSVMSEPAGLRDVAFLGRAAAEPLSEQLRGARKARANRRPGIRAQRHKALLVRGLALRW